MKRSQSVKRLLLGGLTVGALGACSPGASSSSSSRVTTESFFANDDHIPGAGYYHAPFRAFYTYPYNHYDAARRMYFFGGQWAATPHQSIVNLSAPTPEAAAAAQAARTDNAGIRRSGFGSTSNSHFTSS